MMTARMVLVWCVLIAKGIHVILEQPASSLMKCSPWVTWVDKAVGGLHRVHTWMGMFGAATQKPTELLSKSRWVASLHRQRDSRRDSEWDSKKTVRRHVGIDGRTLVSGAAGLKSTQEYPEARGA